MEFIGKTIKKEFKGFGFFSGVVNSYNPSTGLFEIVYEDGDSEELEFSEIVSLFKEMGIKVNDYQLDEAAKKPTRVGRKPKKWGEVEILGNSGENFSNLTSGSFLKNNRASEILSQPISVNDRLNFKDVALGLNGGVDLNVGCNLDDGINLDVSCGEHSKKESVCIDLNVDANGELEECMEETGLGVPAKRKHCFDLNLGLDEEAKAVDGDFDNKLKEENALLSVKGAKKQAIDEGVEVNQVGSHAKEGEEVSFGVRVETHNEAIGSYRGNEGDLYLDDVGKENGIRIGSIGGNIPTVLNRSGLTPLEDQSKEELLDVCTPPPPDNQDNSACAGNNRKAKRRSKLLDGVSSGTEITLRRSRRRLAIEDLSIVGNVEKESGIYEGFEGGVALGDVDGKDLMNSGGGSPDNRTLIDHDYQGHSVSSLRERKRKKRMELPDNGSSTTETVFRRTSRRLAAAITNDSVAQSSTAVDAILEEPFMTSGCKSLEEYRVLPSKLKLPSSSARLDLDGIPIFDLFYVYTFLRSFSTLLFLSPFDLEDLVASLKCSNANILFDSIHVSLLQTLRKHLELLSAENILSASNCLRNLNWDLMDLVTWPIFMVDYLLIHGSPLKSGFDLPKLNLFEREYYKQTAVVKIEILRCLCDDVMEVDDIRLELNRRMLATEPNMDFDRNLRTEISKKRRISVDVSGGSGLTEEVVDETADWNSDECCLCKMDGSLICCDGCPAAYHLKCVGIANNCLPEGSWYCPECAIGKDKPWQKMGLSLRGAEILGVDPYGRLFYSSAGYLLVLDSCDGESSHHYYHRNDLATVVEALKLAGPLYEPILGAISKQLNFDANSYVTKSEMDSHYPVVSLKPMKEQISATFVLQQHVAFPEFCFRDETLDRRKPGENFMAAQFSGSMGCETSAKPLKMENLLTSSEGSVETSQALGTQNLPTVESDDLKKSIAMSNGSETLGAASPVRDFPLMSANLCEEQGKYIQPAQCGHVSPMTKIRQREGVQGQSGIGYINSYSFARTSSMVVEELTRKSSVKIDESSVNSVKDIISAQLKAISKKFTRFCWPICQNLGADTWKEKCGWCFTCRAPNAASDSGDCFFKLNVSDPKFFDNELAGLYSRWTKEGHLVDLICCILCMEDRLSGLLHGPWLNPNYTKVWRKSVIKASDVTSLKYFLLMLEANLHRRALSSEWIKHVDSVTTMGSASHIITTSSRVSSKHGLGRKRARCSDVEPKSSSNAARGLGLLWWRGGRLSRELFNWKVLPHVLASKAARQAGCTKISGLQYSDSSDFTKRSRFVIWQAAVESSRIVEQLALQVRELDANIKWDEIENTHLLSNTDKTKKSMKSFKKVIIRRKFTEGTVVKYLLDFGKRRFIPDIVVTHGSVVEESSSGKKKYWLEDSHVPLHLLKSFEEKRMARKSNKISPGKSHWTDRLTKRASKRQAFSYLFSKAERSEYYQCGHCNKDVLIREAVGCLYCKGFFHKRHVKKSAGSNAAECTYSCHKCQGGKLSKLETKNREKPASQKSKNISVGSRVLRSKTKKKVGRNVKPAERHRNNKRDSGAVVPLRRSPRKLKCVAQQNKKVGRKRKKGKAKGKQIKFTRQVLKKPKNSVWQRKRTQTYRAYWLNGILFSRKPNDERVALFKCKSLVTPSEPLPVSIITQPICSLSCEQDFTPSLSYVNCEICGDWFHGDAFGLTLEKMDSIMGFRCYKCCGRTSPICPHLHRSTNNEAKSHDVMRDGKDLKEPSLGDQSCHELQEHGAISISILGRPNVENGKLPESKDQKREAVECSKGNDGSSTENTAVAMETDLVKSSEC